MEIVRSVWALIGYFVPPLLLWLTVSLYVLWAGMRLIIFLLGDVRKEHQDALMMTWIETGSGLLSFDDVREIVDVCQRKTAFRSWGSYIPEEEHEREVWSTYQKYRE